MAELGDPSRVVGDRSKGIHGQDEGGGHQHAHGRDRRTEDAADVRAGLWIDEIRLLAEPVAGEERDADGDRGQRGGLKADRDAGDDVGRRAGLAGLGDLAHRTVRAGGVVLGQVHEGNARSQADAAGTEEVNPDGNSADPVLLGGAHHHPGHEREASDREQGRHPVAAVEHVHGVLVLAATDEEHGDDGRDQPEGTYHQGEEDPGLGMGPAGSAGDAVDRDAEDHGPDVLGGSRLEQVRAAARAVTDVVPHQVRHDARVARIVLWDPRLDLPHQVRGDVRRLGVDPAAELREERDEAGAEPVPHDQERSLVRMGEAAVQREHRVHAEERQGDHQEPGHRTATKRGLHRADQAVPCSSCSAQIRPHADEHTDDAGGHGARGSDEEREPGAPAQIEAVDVGIGDLLGLDQRDHQTDDHSSPQGQQRDGLVLPANEGDGALEDGPRDLLHGFGPGVAVQDVVRKVERERDGQQARDGDRPGDRLELHQSSECHRVQQAPGLTGMARSSGGDGLTHGNRRRWHRIGTRQRGAAILAWAQVAGQLEPRVGCAERARSREPGGQPAVRTELRVRLAHQVEQPDAARTRRGNRRRRQWPWGGAGCRVG